ncbi:hypothetical protein [Pedobacter sp. L105]|uniref:hypothetical protein n=1 Tax=Pedobacter sp. L105 TaxID=1641871 RepID=UPI00131AF030|nr:hypothetical protein [Pedobacter sp. L105]
MKQILLTVSLILIVLKLSAQNNIQFQNVIPVSTVAPNAAILGRFGNIPVSYATGIPSVTIPLYEINIGKIKLPLSLDYHGGGVRVDEVASSVGTSWALSGIPIISRNMIGLPDENSGGYLSSPSLDSLYNYYQGFNYGTTKDLVYAQYIFDDRDSKVETEPDVFSYTLNGTSGKFMHRRNGSIIQIPVTNNRIEATSGNNFKITDENGMVYYFDQQETTQMITQSATGPGTYVSSWHVSKIIDQSLQDTVSLIYSARGANQNTEHSYNFSYILGDRPDSEEDAATNVDASGENSSIQTTAHYEIYPTEIDWRGGKLTFINVRDRTDRPSNGRLDSVKVYAKQNGLYQLIKSTKLYQSYFYSNPVSGATADYRNYRLRLDSVAYLDVKGMLSPQKYVMTYNNSPIAPNESFGQDTWGYNNGQFNNLSMMPKQSVLWKGIYKTIGEANMDPDSVGTYIQACMLQSIKYPTKGQSVFTFEPHRYPLNYQTYQQQSVSCDASGTLQSTNSTTFTVAANQTSFNYQASFSNYNYPDVSQVPMTQMLDITTGSTTPIFRVTGSIPAGTVVNVPPTAITLIANHQYTITTNIYTTTNANVKATCQVTWSVPISGTVTKTGGGLRVSSITNYDLNGNFINKESYQYGNNGAGTLLTDAAFMQVNAENTFFQIGSNFNPLGCQQFRGDASINYLNRSVYPVSQFSGSPIVYGTVTKSDINAAGTPNGKTVFTYSVFGDQASSIPSDNGNIGPWLISNPWKNGILGSEKSYKILGTVYSPVSSKEYTYQILRTDTLTSLKIKPLYIKMTGGCEIYGDTINTRSNQGEFFITKFPTYTGAMLMTSELDTTYDTSGNTVAMLHNYYYDDLTHILPTRKELINSKGDDLVDVMQYPHNLAAGGNVYQTMLNRNMVAPVVATQQLKNGNQLSSSAINYKDWFGNGNLLLPQNATKQITGGRPDTLVRFNQFDLYGNILQQQKTVAPYAAYQWGYNSQYPVATAVNASSNDIFYDSFEEGDGNSSAGDAKTGHYSHTGSYNKALTGLDVGNYNLTYWLKSGGVWVLQTVSKIAVNTNYYTLSINSGQIDDVRLYLSGSQLSTFTYDPLVGMTSSTDPKNEVTYYEYDGFQRLINIRDKDLNIIKHTDYHYQGQ